MIQAQTLALHRGTLPCLPTVRGMNTQQILRVPFLASALAGVHVMMTPPNAPPPQQEQTATSLSQRYVVGFMKFNNVYVKTCSWVVTVCEICTILSLQFPTSRFFKIALWYLLPNADLSLAIDPTAVVFDPVFYMGAVIAASGGLIRLWCYHTMGRLFTFELTFRKEHELVKSGPYSWVRHPGYLGLWMGIIGIHLCHFSRGSWLRESGVLGTPVGVLLLAVWVGVCVVAFPAVTGRIPTEEKMMRREFGKEWEMWAARVPYKMIPGVY